MLKGIDVSAVQGVVKWDLVRKADVRFAYLKCATGNQVKPDSSYSYNVAHCRKNDVWAGAYLFAFPLPSDGSPAHAGRDPAEQARHHFDLAGGYGRGPGELPPMLDLEWPPPVDPPNAPPDSWSKWGCSARQIAEWTIAYLDEADVLFAGPVGIYTYPWWWAAVVGAFTPADLVVLARRPLWMADYGPAGAWPAEGSSPKPIAPWGASWTFWQVGQRALPGQGGPSTDLDCFNGDEAAMTKLAGGAAT
jgi:GH25 family lysozyme M1 (1,4-beta-N-acetylmuramidase)